MIAAIVLAAVFAVGAGVLYQKWPFTKDRVEASLAGATFSHIRSARFQPVYFPHPGGILEEVTVERGSKTLATVRRMTIVGSWLALFSLQHYVSRMELEKVRVVLPAEIPAALASGKKAAETTIGELQADGAVLQIARTGNNVEPLTFTFAKLDLRNVSKRKAINFVIDAVIPLLPARVLASGSIGPWQNTATRVNGSFQLQDGKLGAFHDLDGKVSANGTFKGSLEKMQVSGKADTPDFRVKRHRVSLQTDYMATVNGLTGDVQLHAVQARLLQTVLQAKGLIESKQPGAAKTVSIDFQSDDARIQDLLRVVTMAEQPAMNGPMRLRTSVVVPPGEGRFLRKLRLEGDFTIRDASFTKAATQTKVSEMSARSRGQDVGKDDPVPERALSDLKGHVVMTNGIATLSQVSFAVPGAKAHGGGTYDVISKRVKLAGQVAMEATVSEASSGLKSFLLKPFNAIFRKKNAGAVLPVYVTGYYPHPKIEVQLRKQ